MPQNIISRNLGKVKIDEIYTHQNAELSKGPDGLNIRGNMYVDNTLGVGTEYTYDTSIRILGNMQLHSSNTDQLLNIKNNLNNTLLNIKNNKIGINTDNPSKELDKYHRGRVLVLAGSDQYKGAASIALAESSSKRNLDLLPSISRASFENPGATTHSRKRLVNSRAV